MTRSNEPPIGIRQNNPGNIERGADRWQGMAPRQLHARYLTFKAPVWGIRAMARVLITYQDKHGLATVESIINRWAPPEDDNPTGNYAAYVAARVRRARGIGAAGGAAEILEPLRSPEPTPVDVHDYEDLRPLIEGMIFFENGQNPYDNAIIDKALVLAGVEPPARDLSKSRTVRGGRVAALGTAATAGAAIIQDVIEPAKEQLFGLAPYLPLAKYGLLALVIAGVAVMLYARRDDFMRGLR